MTDSLKIKTYPKYNSLYKSMKPAEVKRLEHFNGERYLIAKRSQGALKIVTQKLNPNKRVTLFRTMENFGTESNPLLSDVSLRLAGDKGDLVVYVDKAKYHDDVLRAIFIAYPEKIQQRVYKSFAQMRKDQFVLDFLKKIINPKILG